MHAENWGGTVRSSLQPVQRTVFAENSEHRTVFCKTGGCRELFLQRTPNTEYSLTGLCAINRSLETYSQRSLKNVQSALAVCVRLRKK